MILEKLKEEFAACFRDYCPRSVGSESEILGVNKLTGEMYEVSLPFQDRRLIGYEPIYDDINELTVIGLANSEYGVITMDAGSFELESKPKSDVNKLSATKKELIGKLKSILPSDVVLLTHGTQPLTLASWKRWTPKGRYQAMKRATDGRVVDSCITASAQTHVSVGFKELVNALNTANKASGFMIALFANGNIRGGRVDHCDAWREKVWDDFGPEYRDRTGIPVAPFTDYDHLMDCLFHLDTLFYKRCPGDWPAPVRPFAELVNNMSLDEALNIWSYHLSTYWVDVRPRGYGTLEFRMCCPQPWPELMAPDAFALGLVENHEEIADFLNRFTWQEAIDLRADAIRNGIKARIGGQPVLALLKELAYLVIKGLKKRELEEEVFLRNTLDRLHSDRPYTWADKASEYFREGGIPALLREMHY